MPTGMVAAPPSVQAPLTAYNPMAQVRITGKTFLEDFRLIFINKVYGFQAHAAAAAAGVVPNHMQAAANNAAVTGGKLFATYPPSFHALR
jgi:hypothetical protein